MRATVAVIGGGASGVITAVALAREWRAARPLRVVLYDASAVPGRGVAYVTDDERHLLNVPAARMSAVADDEQHFVRWLRRVDPHAAPWSFRPRQDYARYLADTLAEHAACAGLVVRRSEVTDLLRVPDGFVVSHASGIDEADAVVLALGHAPPTPLTAGGVPLPCDVGHIADPWAPGALARVRESASPDSTVLLVGTGLTAVDVALTLGTTAVGPRVIAVSRRGRLPGTHVVPGPQPWPVAPPMTERLTFVALESFVRHEFTRARLCGADWRAVVDGLRPHLPDLWRRLDARERARFLSGPVRDWEVLRHRMAPTVADAIARLRRSGRLIVLDGGLAYARRRRAGWTVVTGRGERLIADVVVNCTGPSSDTTRCRGPLVTALSRRGLVQPDVLGLGLDTAGDGRLRDRHGSVDPLLFAVGPLRKGSAWESTAVPEIRAQARDIAQALETVDTERYVRS